MRGSFPRWWPLPQSDQSRFFLRTATASWLALALATGLGLGSVHWAAMTVWFVAQPDRGALLEKSLFRVLGTMAGAQAGAAIVLIAHGAAIPTFVGLALWVASCAWVGNLMRHFAAYAVLLAGATAAIVVLQSVHQPAHVLDLDFARVANILVGIAVAVVFSLAFSRKPTGIDLAARLQQLREKTMLVVASALTEPSPAKVGRMRLGVVLDIAALEDTLDHAASGSHGAHLRNRHARAVLGGLLSLLSIAGALRKICDREQRVLAAPPQWSQNLSDALRREVRSRSAHAVRKAVRGVGVDSALRGRLLAELDRLLEALDASQSQVHALHSAAPQSSRIVLHRDWLAARYAAWRTLCAIASAGAVWAVSGWHYGNLMLMGVCMFVVLFSPLENPLAILRWIVAGSAVGGLLAVFMRAAVFPWLPSVAWVLALTLPVLLVAAMLMTRPRIRAFATETVLCFLLVAQPGELSLSAGQSPFFGALALFAGAGVSYLTFFLLPPLNRRQRLAELGAMIVRDLKGLVAARHRDDRRWQQRTSHRILRMARLAGAGGGRVLEWVDGCFTILAIGRGVVLIDRLLGQLPATDDDVGSVRNALKVLLMLPGASSEVASVLASESVRLVRSAAGVDQQGVKSGGETVACAEVRETIAEILGEMSLMIESREGYFRAVCPSPSVKNAAAGLPILGR